MGSALLASAILEFFGKYISVKKQLEWSQNIKVNKAVSLYLRLNRG